MMVFVAELIGDRTPYSTSALAMRYPRIPVALGMLLAFMAKMWAAVFAGSLLSVLPRSFVSVVSALTFLAMALTFWFKGPEEESGERAVLRSWSYVFWASFSAVFFTGWGDPGQISAMTLAAGYQHRLTIWVSATAAMATKEGRLQSPWGQACTGTFHSCVALCRAVYFPDDGRAVTY
jgi:putative Ca2+/H+ antiporter (TMEM165/GDT1 family)